MAKKDIRELIRRLEEQGWVVTLTRNSHWRCEAPGGAGIVFLASSPSESRSMNNAKAQLRRLGAQVK